ncbi:hypothetical protein BGZ83_007802 [Gryganskiella cystojenkinii]|nr:hypothetical protein BGZ83_007802 [Gryganskiella cystojenkinii]
MPAPVEIQSPHLHDLLQHYEECHVRFEDDDRDDLPSYEALGNTTVQGVTAGQEADFLDDDSWSDSDSSPSSPSSTSPTMSSNDTSGGSSHSGRISNGTGHSVAEAAPRFKFLSSSTPSSAPTSAPSHTGHLLQSLQQSRLQKKYMEGHRENYGGLPDSGVRSKSDNLTTHAVDSLGFGSSKKRKALISLADIYTDVDSDRDGLPSSAFQNTILRTRASAAASELRGPLAKKQALESNQRSIAAAILSDRHNGLHPLFPFNPPGTALVLPPNLYPSAPRSISPLTGGQVPRPSMLYHPLAPSSLSTVSSSSSTTNSPSPYVTAAVDLMRQRDEVFSILEDMTKPPPNSSSENKPYRCTVSGCDKAYKNPNGLKYHNLHGHCSNGLNDQDGPESKPYVCTFLECGKRYKNLNGLKYHIEHAHPNLIAALRAHQSGLIHHPLLANAATAMDGAAGGSIFPNSSTQATAVMTIAAALQAVEASPMMAAATTAIMTSQANNSNNNSNGALTGTKAETSPATEISDGDCQMESNADPNLLSSQNTPPTVITTLPLAPIFTKQRAHNTPSVTSSVPLLPSVDLAVRGTAAPLPSKGTDNLITSNTNERFI